MGQGRLSTGEFRPVLWKYAGGWSAPMDLGVLGGTGNSFAAGSRRLNGEPTPTVVGNSEYKLRSSDTHAFRWRAGEGMVDLDPLDDGGSGWTLAGAGDIDSMGRISGAGIHRFSKTSAPSRGFVLTPF